MSAIMHTRKYDSLQAGRGLAALMVLLFHIGHFLSGEPSLWHDNSSARWLAPGLYGVDFFFILSGAVMFLAHWGDIGKPQKVPQFFWKRFRRIYPIYWIVLIPTVIKQLHVPLSNQAFDQRNPYVILSSFLLVHIRSVGYNLGPSWTLFHEVLFYLIFAVFLFRKTWGIILFSGWFSASFFYFFTHSSVTSEPTSYSQMLFSPLHLLFAFGLVSGWFLHQKRGPSQLWVLFFGLAVFTLTCVFNAHGPWVRVLGGAGLTLAVLTGAVRERLGKLQVPSSLVFLGDASYSIYLVHFMVISAIARKGFLLDQRWHLPTTTWLALMFVGAVSVGIVLHLFVERPLLSWASRPRNPLGRAATMPKTVASAA